MTRRPWTQTEVDVLTRLYANTPTKQIADKIGRSVGKVYQKAAALGLKKSDEYLAGPHASRLRRGDNVGAEYRFKPGFTPWNKGKPGSTGNHPNTRRTQFKKGSMSGAAQHNYVPIGTLRLSKEGALERKVSDDPDVYPARRWRPVAHLVWEAKNGPIPPKHVVRFKPGMNTNVEAEITVDRLECISMAENMRRNSLHRYPKEITDAIRARAVLNRRINHVDKHQ